ncbi:MAG: methyltransferase domain-containing protein [Planctomycetota bacterium]
MKTTRYKMRFPASDPHALGQDQAFFEIEESGNSQLVRFHDYAAIYKRPGLYEQLFYDRLKCCSPAKVAGILLKVVGDYGHSVNELRVLDVGAGNGMVGEEIMKEGVARLVGLDIIPEAKIALERDRPGLYDDYYVTDLTRTHPEELEELRTWRFDAMLSVAALGFGDIPPLAFVTAFNLVETPGWVAFNIKESFLDADDGSGFSDLVRHLIFDKYIQIHHMERYSHRVSIDGKKLFYYAIAAMKIRDFPPAQLQGA